MAQQGNRGRGGQEQHPGMYGAGTSTPTTSGQRTGATESSGGVAATIKETAQDIASNLGTTAGEAWESTREGVQQAASAVASTAGEAWDSVTTFMRRYPIATLCFGFGIGFLCGRMLANGGMPDFLRSGRYNWWDDESRQSRTQGRYNPSGTNPY